MSAKVARKFGLTKQIRRKMPFIPENMLTFAPESVNKTTTN